MMQRKNTKIEQIEDLSLPKRSEKDVVYLLVRVFFVWFNCKHSFLAELTDISENGLSLVNSKQDIPFTVTPGKMDTYLSQSKDEFQSRL